MLDLFDGKISLNEILDNDIPLIKNLKEAKIRLNAELAKKAAENQKQPSQNVVTNARPPRKMTGAMKPVNTRKGK